jgi:hypothetical protein
LAQVDLYYLPPLFIILDCEYFLVVLGNQWKFNRLDVLTLDFIIVLLPAFVGLIVLVVVLLHRSELAVIIDDVGHALPLPVDRLLYLMVLFLDDVVDLLGRDDFFRRWFLFGAEVGSIDAHGQFLCLVVVLVLAEEHAVVAPDLHRSVQKLILLEVAVWRSAYIILAFFFTKFRYSWLLAMALAGSAWGGRLCGWESLCACFSMRINNFIRL